MRLIICIASEGWGGGEADLGKVNSPSLQNEESGEQENKLLYADLGVSVNPS